MSIIVGILLGLGAAFFQSLSYIFSRMFVGRFANSAVTLLISAHIIMGCFSFVTLLVFWPKTVPTIQSYVVWLVGTALFYLCGQVGLFLALRQSDASRISPLLGLKILFVAAITASLFDERFSVNQVIAIALCVCAAGILSWSRGHIVWQSLLWVLTTCLGYSLSDVCVKQVIDSFLYLGLFHGSVVSAGLCYAFCGVIGAALMFVAPRVSKQMWIYALPFAAAWFLAMLFLFACFGSIGIVFGNIIQSTRGVISVLLGIGIAAAGLVHLEEKMTGPELIRKLNAAIFMVVAIALYYLG